MSTAPLTDAEKIAKALDMVTWGGVDGAHHKQWALDQVARILAGDDYPRWARDNHWDDEGIAP